MQQCSVDQTPYLDGSFDRVLAFDVTEHLSFDTYLFFLFEAKRIIKQGGKLAVLPGMTFRSEHINLLPTEKIAEHMKRVGFEIEQQTPYWVIGVKP